MSGLPVLSRCLAAALLLLAGATSTSPAPTGSGDATGQQVAWPQVEPTASYDIAVTLDPSAHTLAAHETITYYNRSADYLPYLVFHLYLNAFRDSDTVFMRESAGTSRGIAFDDRFPGWTEVKALSLRVEGARQVDLLPATTLDETLMTTTLPQPLLPGEAITLELDFQAQLPRVFARTGFAGDFHMAGQWFPKLAVYREGRGWNAHQFHANSEFFADFGTYDVAITLPQDYVVGASGLPAGHQDHPDGNATHRYHAEAVIDFAWAAWPGFREAHRHVGPIEVLLLYDPAHEAYASRYLDAAEHALTHYGDWYGPYPYPRLTLVDVPDHAAGAGGMEYPTLVTLGTLGVPPLLGDTLFPELVTVHEIAHQWWQSTVASNEFEEPWLDEGFAEYSAQRLLRHAYGPIPWLFDLGPFRMSTLDLDRMQYLLNPTQPIYGRAWDFSLLDYGVAAYYKPTLALTTLERVLGEERWLTVMRTYYQRYQFRHPTTGDFLDVLEEVAGPDIRSDFEQLLYKRGQVDHAVIALACAPTETGHHCEATVARLGEIALPVEVELAFADGQRVRELWDTGEASRDYVYNRIAPLDWVQVDPERKICLDVDWRNNSMTRQVQTGAVAQFIISWFYTLEHLILILGGLW